MKRIDLVRQPLAEAIAEACAALKDGGLVVFPTETIYGIAADAQNAEAVTSLLKYKQRPAGKAISVLVKDEKQAERYVVLNDSARKLYETFLPGPVTVVSTDRGLVDSRLVSEFGTLGIRISSHPIAQALSQAFDGPLTATSANPSGGARPYSIDGLLTQLSANQRDRIALVLDAGVLPPAEPSTVIDTTQNVQTVVRSGANLEDVQPPLRSSSPEDTKGIAQELIRSHIHTLAEKPLVITLEGEMGMGKTCFSQGVGQALGVKQLITSPSYVLVKEYVGQVEGTDVRMVHIDCWRAISLSAAELALEEYLQPGTVTVIEWPDPLLTDLRHLGDRIVWRRLRIESDGEETRRIHLVK